jgi:HlyD family secretion protein
MSILRPVKTEEFIPPIGLWATLGGMMLIGAVGLGFTLTALVKFNLTVKGAGIVRPDRELSFVQAPIDGKISSIEVNVNEKIQQGAIIARLDRFTGETQQQQLQNNLQQTHIQIDRLNSQIQLLDTQILAEKNSLDREIAVARVEIDRTQRDYRQQTTTLNANLSEAEAQLKLAKSEMKRYQQLANTGAITQLQLEEKQTAVSSAEAQIARTKAALNPSLASLKIAQARVTQQQAKSQAALADLSREREALQQGHSELQAQLLKEQKELQQLDRQLQSNVIRSNSDGIIFQLNLRNREQIVRSGDTIAEIAPINNQTTIKTAIATEDIDRVKSGQLAQMRIDACPYSDYGVLRGTVAAISPDAIIPNSDRNRNKLNSNSTEPYFEVTIQPKTNVLTSGNLECQLKPGMRAEVNIIAKQETILKFILRKARLLTNF